MRSWWWSIVALVLVGAFSSPAAANGGRLESTRASVRTPPSARTPQTGSGVRGPPPGTRTTQAYSRPAPTRVAGPRPTMTVYHVVRRSPGPAVPPPRALGPRAEAPRLQAPPVRPPFQRFVHRWPYEARKSGWIVDPWTANPKDHRRVGGHVSGEASYLYRGMWRSGFAARVGSPRLDVDTQMSFYLEAPTRDALYLGDTTLNFAPVAAPQIVWRVGFGARYMLDARLPGAGVREYAAGWNASTSLDAFPGSPFVLSARLDRGTLYQTPVWRARATVGLVRERFELFAGYDHTQVERVALGGPLLGLRAWL